MNISLKVIVSWPTNPLYYILYFALFLPVLMITPSILSTIFLFTGLGFRISLYLGALLFMLSLILSFVNIGLFEIKSFTPRIDIVVKYIYYWGIPLPLVFPRIIINRIIIAVNLGGCLIPLMIDLYILCVLLTKNILYFIYSLLIIFFVSLITYSIARGIPGVGIVVPGFIPPLVSVILTIILIHDPLYAVPISFLGGSLGSLIGADILRLRKELPKFKNIYGGAVLSIGGAGTFDGIFLSGLFAVLFTYLFLT